MSNIVPKETYAAVLEGGLLTARFPARNFSRILIRLRVNGPPGSAVEVYVGSTATFDRIDNTPYGTNNTADYGGSPEDILSGRELIVRWNTGSGSASATATFQEAGD